MLTEARPLEKEPPLPEPMSFKEAVGLFRDQREMILYTHLQNSVHLVHFEPGRIELRPSDDAPRDLINRVSDMLGEWTGQRWVVMVSSETGDETLRDQACAEDQRLIGDADSDELVRAVKGAFPGAAVTKVTNREPAAIPDAGPVEEHEDGED